ncbi:hypothetical protein [Frigidibacter sp. ROC022]|uniref:hypothetical protein n=1 Tax=Frigidibacter sp. ROC022 TaxID=2971796 RepID=UPI00215B35A2|nr:hypothetical protein [Frigidibacter sp. ROC022]MCR8724550.1 hypothetical protein [Frigidibacter sp. ROC022]
MINRKREIGAELKGFLDRYTPPFHLRQNEKARQEEGSALLKVLIELAPKAGYMPWVRRALEICSRQMKTRAWPTVGELYGVCSNQREEGALQTGPRKEVVFDELAINAARIRAGDSVGDYWIFGRGAAELTSRGYITEEQRQRYSKHHIDNTRTVMTEEEARSLEAQLNRNYARAKQDFKAK